MLPSPLADPAGGDRRRPALTGLCAVCHQAAAGALCGDCRARFAAPRLRCGCCALPLGAAAPRCGHCLRQPPRFVQAVAAVDYGFPWDALIARFKFQREPELAGPLADLLADAVVRAAPPPVDEVLPVPLAPARLSQRGYNQAWELARRVARARGIAAHAGRLLRPADTAHQAELSRAERQRNLHGAFMVDPRQRTQLAGRRVALVDDVMTTGATADEAAATLLRAGVREVQLWVLARTPEEPRGA